MGVNSRLTILVLVVGVICSWPASADLQSALNAYQRRDYVSAAREFRVLARQGVADAQLALGGLYASGVGVPQDYVQAHKWLNLAAAQGKSRAARARDRIAGRMTRDQIARARRMAREFKPVPAAAADSAPGMGSPQATPAVDKKEIREIQASLTELGYKPGPADGLMGARTRRAIERFQTDNGLPIDGRPTPRLRAKLSKAIARRLRPQPPDDRVEARNGTIRATAKLKKFPRVNARTIRVLAGATRVRVVGRLGAWYRVTVGNSEGWVRYSMVRLGPVAANPAAASLAKPAEKRGGGIFSGFARGLTGLVNRFSKQQAPRPEATVTIGIRGLSSGDLRTARPNPAELRKLDSFAAGDSEARRFARQAQLATRRIAYLPGPQRVSAGSERRDDDR